MHVESLSGETGAGCLAREVLISRRAARYFAAHPLTISSGPHLLFEVLSHAPESAHYGAARALAQLDS